MNIVYKVHSCTACNLLIGCYGTTSGDRKKKNGAEEKEQKGCVYRLLRRSTLGWMC